MTRNPRTPQSALTWAMQSRQPRGVVFIPLRRCFHGGVSDDTAILYSNGTVAEVFYNGKNEGSVMSTAINRLQKWCYQTATMDGQSSTLARLHGSTINEIFAKHWQIIEWQMRCCAQTFTQNFDPHQCYLHANLNVFSNWTNSPRNSHLTITLSDKWVKIQFLIKNMKSQERPTS